MSNAFSLSKLARLFSIGNASNLLGLNSSGDAAVITPASPLVNLPVVSVNSGQIAGFTNEIINGDMQVSQVNGGTAVTPTTSAYVIDQWHAEITQASKLTFQQVVDAPAGLKYSLKCTVAAQYSPIATDSFVIRQPIEGQNLVEFGFGTAAPATLAVSLWVKGSVAGTYAVTINNGAVGGTTHAYIGTITVGTTWARQTVILTADTTASAWANDNTAGLWLYIDLGSGSNFNGTAGTWQAIDVQRTTGSVTFVNQVATSTLNITGVQLEAVSPGATSGTTFETVNYATQLSWCQRYLPYFTSETSSGGAYAATLTLITGNFPTPVRIAPIGYVSILANLLYNGSNTSGAVTGITIAATGTISYGLIVTTTAGSPTLTVGQSGRLQSFTGYFTGAQM